MDLWKRIKHYRSSSATGSIVAWHGLKADAVGDEWFSLIRAGRLISSLGLH